MFGITFTSIGIGLLLVVFYLAYQMLTHPVPGLADALAPTAASAGGTTNSVGKIGGSVAAFLLKLAVLFLMTLAGSHVAARGIQLYHGGAAHASAVLRSASSARAGEKVAVPVDGEPVNSGASVERQ